MRAHGGVLFAFSGAFSVATSSSQYTSRLFTARHVGPCHNMASNGTADDIRCTSRIISVRRLCTRSKIAPDVDALRHNLPAAGGNSVAPLNSSVASSAQVVARHDTIRSAATRINSTWPFPDHAWPTHLAEVPEPVRLHYEPRRRASPFVCMVLTFTPEVIFFSRFATEQNVNWALAHGYSASLYSAALLPPQHHILWSQPYATLLEAERPECSFLLHLEADVVINAVQRSFAPVLERFMQAPGTELLLSCHSPFATPDGSCHQPACSCTRRSATSSNQKPSIPA